MADTLGFKKIDKMRYEYTVSPELFKKMDEFVVSISNGKVDKCFDAHNMYLVDSLIARYVATLFLDTGETMDNAFGMCVITVRVEHRTFKLSLGYTQLSKDENVLMHGVFYDD